MIRVLLPVLLLGCEGGSFDIPRPPLALTVDAPVYGQFAGDSPTVVVSGSVTDATATVWVDGRAANVGTDGTFRVDVPVPGPYRVIDIEAANPDAHLRQRVPVFSGHDPMETWPGQIAARVTPLGLLALGDSLEPTIDALGLTDTLFDVLPSIDAAGFVFVPIALTTDPADVTLTAAETGLHMDIAIRDLVFEAEVEIPLLGGDTLFLGIDEVVLGIGVSPEVDASGMLWLALEDSTVELGAPILETGTFDPVILEALLADTLAGLGPTVESAVDGALAAIGSIPLGGPLQFETNLLGTDLALGIDDLYGDIDGLALVLGVDLGNEGAATGLRTPDGRDAHEMSHAVIALHEGLFQLLLGSDLLDLFSQDLELGGLLGNVLALPIQALPGGEAAPPADGWCMTISPGAARVARLQPSMSPLAVMYLPDFQFDIGYQPIGSTVCTPWLLASVALEVGIGLGDDGALDLDLDIGEGAVLYYATTAPYDEKGVIDGLGALLDVAMGFLGGDLLGGLNLGDLLGGGTGTGTGLGGLPIGELDILDVREVRGDDDQPIEGTVAISARVF